MVIVARIALCLLVTTTTCACSSDGRPRFISDVGISEEVNGARALPAKSDGLLFQFKLAAEEARPYVLVPSAKLINNDPVKQRAFMEAGFALIQARCNSYILSKADNQRQVNVWRDTFAPVTALLTGALALISKGGGDSNDALTIFSLGTSGASAGFRIYEQRFLFGAENVNSVRLLVLKALIDNSITASKTLDKNLTYSQSVIHLINNQAVCSPAHILQLVSAAIEAGKVESKKSDVTAEVVTDTKADEELKQTKAVISQLKQDKGITDQDIDTARVAVAKNLPSSPAPSSIASAPQSSGLEIVTTRVVDR